MTTINSWLLQGQKEEQFLISDIAKHGCAGGIGGLIYYNETASFTMNMRMRFGPSYQMPRMPLGSLTD